MENGRGTSLQHTGNKRALAQTGQKCQECTSVKSVGSTPVQCVDHLVPLCSGTFSFSVLGVGAE